MVDIYEFFKSQLILLSNEKKLSIHPQVVDYIASVIMKNYKEIPLYIIDVKASTIFQLYKKRGDVSLILVGLFTEWINRLNRPLKEEDYIFSGKLNYKNAYEYLEKNYKKLNFKELEIEEKVLSFSDIFFEMSQHFEFYADLLKGIRKKAKENYEIYRMYGEILDI